ncbi:MAG: hypothetical protein GY870_17900 [archaeon]|nr:hypothetical protein [archaeon]
MSIPFHDMLFGKKLMRIVAVIFIAFIVGIMVGKGSFISSIKSRIDSALNLSFETQHKISSYHQDKIDLFNALGGSSSEILFVGDSLIDNGEWQELLPNHQVINRGIQGIIISDLLNLVQQIKLIKAPKIFVMIGVNDLRRGLKQKNILTSYSNLINQLLENFELVFIHSILLGPSYEEELNIKTMDFNSNLEKLSKKNKRVVFINLNPMISPEGYISKKFSFDGIHLNGSGYMIWRDAVKLQIDRIYN